jgi:hypothetical protein
MRSLKSRMWVDSLGWLVCDNAVWISFVSLGFLGGQFSYLAVLGILLYRSWSVSWSPGDGREAWCVVSI